MNQILIDKIRKARETNLPLDKTKSLTIRRPTDLEALGFQQAAELKEGDIICRFTVDWAGFTELDLIPGGTGIPVPFDPDLFCEWIADHPQYWNEISNAILKSYRAHREQLDSALGEL